MAASWCILTCILSNTRKYWDLYQTKEKKRRVFESIKVDRENYRNKQELDIFSKKSQNAAL